MLSTARQQQGLVNGKAHAIGLAHQDLTQIIDEIWVQEVIATAAIENQKLDLDQVRSSVMRKLGLGKPGHSSRDVDGLVDVMHDATANYHQPLDLDRVCRWQSALFPGGTSGIKRIQTGQLRSFSEPMQIVSGKPNEEKVHFWAIHSHNVFNVRQRKSLQKLLDAGAGGFLGGLTAEKHVKITGVSKATATRDLTDLVQKGALIVFDQGRASKYFINIPGWNKEVTNKNAGGF